MCVCTPKPRCKWRPHEQGHTERGLTCCHLHPKSCFLRPYVMTLTLFVCRNLTYISVSSATFSSSSACLPLCCQVTMADRSAADRACKDPNPIIDGRKANVNLAYLGAKPRVMQPGKDWLMQHKIHTWIHFTCFTFLVFLAIKSWSQTWKDMAA